MNTQKWLAAGLISLSALAVGVVPAQASTAGSSQTKEAYVKQLKPGVKAYARAVKGIDREIDKAPKQTDAQVAAKFTTLTKQVTASGKQIEAVKAPSAFAARQKAVTGSIRLVARDTARIVRAAQAHSEKQAERAGAALGRDLKKSARALNALDKALDA